MKIIIVSLLITLAFASSNIQTLVNSMNVTPEQQIIDMGCQTTLQNQLNICSNVETTQSYYFEKFYQCLTSNSTYLNQTCANVYCNKIGYLSNFGVNCSNYNYNYTIQYKKNIVQPNITADCVIGSIAGCEQLLNSLEPFCQQTVNVRDVNYFSDFFNCIIANTTMQSLPGCSKCYCLGSRFDAYGVDCNLTKPPTPQQQIEAIPGCSNALNSAVASCVNLNDTQASYYHDYYMCINAFPMMKTVSPMCPFLYCSEIEHLDVFGVNCMNFTYNLNNVTNKTANNSTQRNLTCHIQSIQNCEPAINLAVDACQSIVPVNATNYYGDFYNCISNQDAVKQSQGCGQCYCETLELVNDCTPKTTSVSQLISFIKQKFFGF